MIRRAIPQIISLPERAQGELPFAVEVDGYASHHTLTLMTPDLADLEALQAEGHIDGYVIVGCIDDDGYATGETFAQILVSQAQLTEAVSTNITHRLAEKQGLASARRQDLPAKAKRKNGEPIHRFYGHD